MEKLSEFYDTRVLQVFDIVRSSKVVSLIESTKSCMEGYGKPSIEKGISWLYDSVIDGIPNFSTDMLYCLFDYRSPRICGLLGWSNEIRYHIDKLGEDDITSTFLKSQKIKGKTMIIALVPTKALFCEFEEED